MGVPTCHQFPALPPRPNLTNTNPYAPIFQNPSPLDHLINGFTPPKPTFPFSHVQNSRKTITKNESSREQEKAK